MTVQDPRHAVVGPMGNPHYASQALHTKLSCGNTVEFGRTFTVYPEGGVSIFPHATSNQKLDLTIDERHER